MRVFLVNIGANASHRVRSPLQVIGSHTRSIRPILDSSRQVNGGRLSLLWKAIGAEAGPLPPVQPLTTA